MRIAVCRPRCRTTYGGAEVVADQLADELRLRGHEVELIAIPYSWVGPRVLDNALVWRMLDVNQTPGKPTDLVIATKFPSYGVRHPNKVVWLVHQFRQAYDFDRTEFAQFGESPSARATMQAVQRFDKVALGEARRDLHDLRERRRPAEAVLGPRRRPSCRRRRRSSPTAPRPTTASSSRSTGSTATSASTS